jgi:hypothetical protein
MINEIAHKKIINCNKITELNKFVGKFLYKLKCKWENEVKNIVQGFRGNERGRLINRNTLLVSIEKNLYEIRTC